MINKFSVVIITKNAASSLSRTLLSVESVAEVIVYDNGSTDNTIEIANSFANVTVVKGDFFGFGPTKNKALALSSNDWVFSLDSDEVLSEALTDELSSWEPSHTNQVFRVRRDNYFMGKHVRRAGWGGDYLVRLFNRRTHKFSDAAVHEKVVLSTNSEIIDLSGPILHYAVDDVGSFLRKIDRYSELRMNSSDKIYPPIFILFKSLYAFLYSYFIQLGFLSGWRGMVISVSKANGVFYKYMKIYAKLKG